MNDTKLSADTLATLVQAISSNQLHMLRHSLGLDRVGSRGEPYRNYYVCGPECDSYRDCRQLVRLGLMMDRGPQDLMGRSHVFHVSDAGIVLVNHLAPPAEKQTAGQLRYQAWLASDSPLSFIDWLKCKSRNAYEDHQTTEV